MARLIVHKHFPWQIVISTVVFCGALAALFTGGFFIVRDRAPIPDKIEKQVNFPIFLPTEQVKLDTQSYKYDPTQKVFTFTGRMAADGQTVTFAEQPTPDSFTDIPNYYDQFLKTLFNYESFDTVQGTVYLTHPKNAGQAAVMNAKGVLLFARVDHDESRPVWYQVFTKLKLYEP